MSRKKHDYLYVVVDIFSKMCILMPCKKTITAEQTADLYFQHVWVIMACLLLLLVTGIPDLLGIFGPIYGI